MQKAIDETNRRRKIQIEYNKKHNITPATIKKEIRKGLIEKIKARKTAINAVYADENEYEKLETINQVEQEMLTAAKNLEFEKATFLRDKLKQLKELPQLEENIKTTKYKNKKKRKK